MKAMILPAVLFLSVLLSPCLSMGDLYQWVDKDGVLHITDDMGRVPEKERPKVKVFRIEPPVKAVEPAPEPGAPVEAPPEEEAAETTYYGDQSLQWWKETFNKKTEDEMALESAIAVKRQFISIFESGRRFGQTYGEAEIETYKRYKEELPEDERRLEDLKAELEELKRKARVLGVPKSIRKE